MITPGYLPRQTELQTRRLLEAAGVFDTCALLGVRGYYRDTMGELGKNDRGIYDDAIFLCTPDVHAAFHANTDPSIARAKVAVLKTGVWLYRIGYHKAGTAHSYKALVQAAIVTVIRDGSGPDTGWFGINIHRGTMNSTSSLGCQTIPPTQWPAFIALVEAEMKRHGQSVIHYVLIDGPTR